MTRAASFDQDHTTTFWRDRLFAFRGAAFALYGLLGVNIVVAAAAFATCVDQRSLLTKVRTEPWTVTLDQVHTVADRTDVVNGFAIGTVVLTAIAFAVWTWLAYSRLAEFGYARRLGAGWALGAWFVPVANLYLPKRIIDDLVDAGTSPESLTAETVSLRRWTTAWWAAWIITVISGFVARNMQGNAKTIDTAMSAATAYMVRDVLVVVSAMLAIVAVHRVTRQQRELVVSR
jgi:hypothetical protein